MKLHWHDLSEFGLEGRGWADTAHPYDRLPARAEGVVREVIWDLSRRATGFCHHFATDATELHARVMLRVPAAPEHGYVKHLDLYARDPAGQWRWAGNNRYGLVPSGQSPLQCGLDGARREYRLYLGTHYVYERVELGVPPGATVTPLPASPAPPLVVYGTSVVQGSSASRPGMIYPAILGRRLGVPVINLGFSGSCNMEPEVAPFLAELQPGAFMLDPLPNMSLELVQRHAEPFLRTLLARHPRTPILLCEDRTHSQSWLFPAGEQQRAARRAAFRAIYERLLGEGYQALSYQEGEALLAGDADATVDGSHPNDYGYMLMTNALLPRLRPCFPQTAGRVAEKAN